MLVSLILRINAHAAFLSNYEVMQILQKLKDSTQKKYKREESLATVTYEVRSASLYRFASLLLRIKFQ